MRVLLVVVLALLAAPAAQALPGDPPVTPLTPANGATLPANPAGIPITFRCPTYRQDVYGSSEDPITDFGTSDDYEVNYSPVRDVDSTGVLGSEYYSVASTTVSGDICTTALDTQDSGTSPDAVGGPVFWQVTRPCVGCMPNQREIGPVRSFTVRGPKIASKVKVRKRVYAGYLTEISVTTKAEVGGGRVQLQRKVGKRWRTIGKGDAGEQVDFYEKLPRGKHRLRGVITTLGGSSKGKVRTVVARPDRNRSTSGADDGKYTAKGGARLTVKQGGRFVTGFQTPVTALCFGASVEDNRFMVLFAGIDKARIAPDGSVFGRLQTKTKGAESIIRGRVTNGRFKGEGFISISASRCSGTREVDLKRR